MFAPLLLLLLAASATAQQNGERLLTCAFVESSEGFGMSILEIIPNGGMGSDSGDSDSGDSNSGDSDSDEGEDLVTLEPRRLQEETTFTIQTLGVVTPIGFPDDFIDGPIESGPTGNYITSCHAMTTDTRTGTVYLAVGYSSDIRFLKEAGSKRLLQSNRLRALAVLDVDTLDLTYIDALPDNIAGMKFDSDHGRLWGLGGARDTDDGSIKAGQLFEIAVNGPSDVSVQPYCSATEGESWGISLNYIYNQLYVSYIYDDDPMTMLAIDVSEYNGQDIDDPCNMAPVDLDTAEICTDRLMLAESRNGFDLDTGANLMSPAAYGITCSDLLVGFAALREDGSSSEGMYEGPSIRLAQANVDGFSYAGDAMTWTSAGGCADTLSSVVWYDPLDTPLTTVNCPTCTFAVYIGGTPYYHPPGPKEAYVRREDCSPSGTP